MKSGKTMSRPAEGFAYGPVPSRRLGRSLGVNTVPPKTCTYSCIYCQLGRTDRLSVERHAYYRTELIINEIYERMRNVTAKPDYVTFLGYGEPTLASNIGDISEGLSRISDSRQALLTNGALLWMPDVRRDVQGFDVVLPTVSAGTERLFKKIHRPHPTLSNKKVLSGIQKFSEEFDGEIWVEVMLLRGINDDRTSLEEINKSLRPIRTDKIHLTAPTRPPTEKGVRCPTRGSIDQALSIITGSSDMTQQETGDFTTRKETPVYDLLMMAAVHPMREEQALMTLEEAGLSHDEAIETLRHLVEQSAMVRVEHLGRTFYRTRR